MRRATQIAVRLTPIAMAAFLLAALPATADAAPQTGNRSLAAAPLAKGMGYELPHGSERVRVLQRRLRLVGERPGPIDGRFGPLTQGAVTRFQLGQELAVDGLVGPATQRALRSATRLLALGAGYGAPDGSARVRALQRSLRTVGERPGPIDGRFGPRTEAAAIRFQRRHGLAADGLVGDATMAAVRKATSDARTRVSAPKPQSQPRPTGSVNGAPAVETRPAPGSPSEGSVFSHAVLAVISGLALGAGLALTLAGAVARRGAPRPRGGAAPVGLSPEALALQGASPSPNEEPGAERTPMLGYAIIPAAGLGVGRHTEELRAQFQSIRAECRRRGLVLVDVVREREPERGKGLQRPGLGYALRRIANGEASGLVVADLARISRSATDLGEVLEWFSRARVRLVAATPGLDTSEQSGRLATRALIEVSRWERARLSAGTREGLAAARLAGRSPGRSGVADNPELGQRIARMRAKGMTLQAIADRLNKEGVPTVRGGALWRPSSVQAAVGYRRPQHRWPAGGVPDPEGPGTEEGGVPM